MTGPKIPEYLDELKQKWPREASPSGESGGVIFRFCKIISFNWCLFYGAGLKKSSIFFLFVGCCLHDGVGMALVGLLFLDMHTEIREEGSGEERVVCILIYYNFFGFGSTCVEGLFLISCRMMERSQLFTRKKKMLDVHNPGKNVDLPRNSSWKPCWSQKAWHIQWIFPVEFILLLTWPRTQRTKAVMPVRGLFKSVDSGR